MPNRRPQLQLITPASPEEAAAVVAAVERFLRDHTPPVESATSRTSPWTRAARLEATGADGRRLGAGGWGDRHTWD